MRINNLRESIDSREKFKSNNFKGSLASRALGVFYDSNAVLPICFIEAGVTLGRSGVAYRRGGAAEASDRFVEQGVSAVVWIWGVQILKKINEKLALAFLNLKDKNRKIDFDFDIGFDELRNPVKNNLKNNKISKNIAGFKMVNLLTSTALATYFIGFILPKINHKITNFILRKEKSKQEQNEQMKNEQIKNAVSDSNAVNTKVNSSDSASLLSVLSFEEYRLNHARVNEEEFGKQLNKSEKRSFDKSKADYENNNIAFTSSFLSSFAHLIENNSKFRMFLTDSGVISGRFINGVNIIGKLEGLFRDVASIYFYLSSSKHIVKLLNKITKNTDINPITLNETVKYLSGKINETEKSKISPKIPLEEFDRSLKDNISKEDISKLDNLFNKRKVVSLEEFSELFKDRTLTIDKAYKMTNLQPVFDDKRFLSYIQARDVLSGSILSDPEFLKNTMNKTTHGKSDNPLKFVSMEFLENERKSIRNFAENVVLKARKENNNFITKDFIEKIANNTTKKNLIYNVFATLVSTFVLAIIIPKIQYYITKKITHENKFPGAQEYNK